jgi:hypothetical protein
MAAGAITPLWYAALSYLSSPWCDIVMLCQVNKAAAGRAISALTGLNFMEWITTVHSNYAEECRFNHVY